MLRTISALIGAFLLTGCADDVPDNETLDRIEALLVRSACVGSLDRWSRHYSFQRRDSRINKGVIWIQLHEAGHRGVAAGRYTDGAVFDMIDDSQFRLAFGDYDVARHTISDWSCGSNYPVSERGSFPEPAPR